MKKSSKGITGESHHGDQTNLGYQVSLEAGPVLRPTEFRMWPDQASKNPTPATAPLKYQADLLLGCAYLTLLQEQSPAEHDLPTRIHPSAKVCSEVWYSTEPHVAFFNESQNRIRAIAKHLDPMPASTVKKFESQFLASVHRAIKPDGRVDLKELGGALECIHFLEGEMKTPLLYNFSCQFSEKFVKTLQALDSFLFNLRNLVAIDFNNLIEDPSHEALKVDSVTDYLPKGDYVVSDAVLYWQIKKLTHPFVAGKRSDVRLEKLLVNPIESAFKQYAYNACHLIDHLPTSFLKAINGVDLEDTLYLVQMDWLLGSGTGLLFKIREELFGVQSGYERIFWPELEDGAKLKPAQLSIHIRFAADEILGHKRSA